MLGGAINAQPFSAPFQDRLARARCRVWGAMGKERGGLKTLSSDNPAIDYAQLAQAHGVYAEGPINEPKLLNAALRRPLAVVKSGRPALVDVICQPRQLELARATDGPARGNGAGRR